MSKDGPLAGKYVVARKDGSDGPGGKHDGCDYFVLDLTHDPYAVDAALAYAQACRHTHPQLAVSLREKLTELNQQGRFPKGESRWQPVDTTTGKPAGQADESTG